MKDIKGYEGLYAIEEDGRIWSYPKTWKRKKVGVSSHKGKWLKPTLMKIGYHMVSLIKDGVPTQFYVHRLIADAFLQRLEINHKNGIKTDNRLENLEWITPSQNSLHAKQVLKIGVSHGEKHPKAKLTDDKVREMRRLRDDEKKTHKEIAQIFGVDSSVVCRIVNRQYWTHVK